MGLFLASTNLPLTLPIAGAAVFAAGVLWASAIVVVKDIVRINRNRFNKYICFQYAAKLNEICEKRLFR